MGYPIGKEGWTAVDRLRVRSSDMKGSLVGAILKREGQVGSEADQIIREAMRSRTVVQTARRSRP